MKTQLKFRRALLGTAIIILIIEIIVISLQNDYKYANIDGIPISYLRATYAIDYGNMNEVVGDADYVFVGTIESERDTVYKNVENSAESSPYTNYTVDVVENIKGNLTMKKSILIQKAGGISQNKTEYVVYEGDELPVVGNTYIFFAYSQPDGSLLLSGPVSNILLDMKINGDFKNTIEYEDIVEAYENQVDFNRQRYTSVYEE